MNIAPQDICIEIRIDVNIQRYFVGLKKINGNLHFEWQEWVEESMRFVTGYNNRCGGKLKYERKIRKSDLQDGIAGLCPLRTDYDEIFIEMISVGVWMEWPMFDVHTHESKME